MKERCINPKYQEEELSAINWATGMKENGLTTNLTAREDNNLVMEVNILAPSETAWNTVLKKAEPSSKRKNNHLNLWLFIENITRCTADNSKMGWCMATESWPTRTKIFSILGSLSEARNRGMALWKPLKEDWQVISTTILSTEKVSSIGTMAGSTKVSSETANFMAKGLSPILKATLWAELGATAKMKTSGLYIKLAPWRNRNMWLKADLAIRAIGSKITEKL